MKFKPSYGTEIYVSDAGYLCIKQTDWPNEDQIVMLSPDQVRELAANINDLLVDQDVLWTENEEEGAK